MLLSIITVTKDDKQGLIRTLPNIASLLDKRKDVEHIIIDGASSFSVSEVACQYSPYSKCFSELDGGIYDAMNKGFLRAVGRYVVFINSGDIFIGDTVFEKHLDGPGADLFYGDAYEDDGETRFLKKSMSHRSYAFGMFTHHQAMIFSREFAERFNLSFDTNFRIAGDWDFVCRFIMNGAVCSYAPTPLCVFLAGGVSQTKIKESRREVFDIRRRYFGAFSAYTHQVKQALTQKLRRLSPRAYWSLRKAMLRLFW